MGKREFGRVRIWPGEDAMQQKLESVRNWDSECPKPLFLPPPFSSKPSYEASSDQASAAAARNIVGGEGEGFFKGGEMREMPEEEYCARDGRGFPAPLFPLEMEEEGDL